MFDKEKAIAEWRARLGRSGTLFEGDLDELESHLRDELDALEEVELTGAPAFAQAEKRLGEVSVLAAEFAKVNPLLAWRTALFWLTMGCFVTFIGEPIFELSIHAVINLGLTLHLPPMLVRGGVWAVGLGVPLIFYALFFRAMSRRIGKPFKLLSSKIFRVALVVGGAVSMLFGHLHGPLLHNAEYKHWGDSAYWQAWNSWSRVTNTLGIALPIGLAALALLLRYRAVRGPSHRVTDAPIFWLVIGCFVAVLREVFKAVVQEASWLGGAATRLNPNQMTSLVWFLAFACPLSIAFSTWAFLRFRSPAPRDLLRSRTFVGVIGLSCVAGVASVLALSHNWTIARDLMAQMDRSSMIAAGQAWYMSNIFPNLLIPTLLGIIMLRMWKSAHAAGSTGLAA